MEETLDFKAQIQGEDMILLILLITKEELISLMIFKALMNSEILFLNLKFLLDHLCQAAKIRSINNLLDSVGVLEVVLEDLEAEVSDQINSFDKEQNDFMLLYEYSIQIYQNNDFFKLNKFLRID